MRIPLVKIVGEVAIIPWWSRIAWWRVRDHTAVVLPIGIHWLARQAHALWYWSFRYRGSRWDAALLQIESAGQRRGYDAGYARARRVLRENLMLDGKDDFLVDKLLPLRPALFPRRHPDADAD
jgi:hypothetical protein